MRLKKVGALVVAGALLTMGGVYATWNFAEDSVSPTNTVVGFGIQLGASTTDKGTYKITNIIETPENPKSFAVCQLGSDFVQNNWQANTGTAVPTGDTHLAVLMANPTAKFSITFVPNKDAEADIRLNGPETAWTYSFQHSTTKYKVASDGTYDPDGTETNVFKLKNDADGDGKDSVTILPYDGTNTELHWDRSDTVNEDGVYTFTYEITAQHIVNEHIQLSQDFIVDTLTAFEAFRFVIGEAMLRVDIAEI